MKVSTLSLVVVLSLGLFSCSSPKSVYKDFYKGQSYQKAGVLTDVTVLQDAKGAKENFLADKSQELLQTIHASALAELQAKGYATYGQYQATGLSLPAEMQAFVSNDPKAQDGPALTGAYQIVRGSSTPSKTQVYAVERLFERMLPLNLLSKKAKESTFPEVRDLGVPTDRYLVVVSGLSRNVNAGKQIGQGLLIAAVTLGTVVAWEPDTAVIQVALIDPATQKIVWANQSPGGKGKSESVRKDLAKLFETLPAYGSVKE